MLPLLNIHGRGQEREQPSTNAFQSIAIVLEDAWIKERSLFSRILILDRTSTPDPCQTFTSTIIWKRMWSLKDQRNGENFLNRLRGIDGLVRKYWRKKCDFSVCLFQITRQHIVLGADPFALVIVTALAHDAFLFQRYPAISRDISPTAWLAWTKTGMGITLGHEEEVLIRVWWPWPHFMSLQDKRFQF